MVDTETVLEPGREKLGKLVNVRVDVEKGDPVVLTHAVRLTHAVFLTVGVIEEVVEAEKVGPELIYMGAVKLRLKDPVNVTERVRLKDTVPLCVIEKEVVALAVKDIVAEEP